LSSSLTLAEFQSYIPRDHDSAGDPRRLSRKKALKRISPLFDPGLVEILKLYAVVLAPSGDFCLQIEAIRSGQFGANLDFQPRSPIPLVDAQELINVFARRLPGYIPKRRRLADENRLARKLPHAKSEKDGARESLEVRDRGAQLSAAFYELFNYSLGSLSGYCDVCRRVPIAHNEQIWIMGCLNKLP
jgi:hypothetical protein